MKQSLRLIYILGKVKMFFSFDPDFMLCNRCKSNKATVFSEKSLDGGARTELTRHCDKCHAKLQNR